MSTTAVVFLVFAAPAPAQDGSSVRAFVENHCADCHSDETAEANLNLTESLADFATHADVWERVVRKLRARQMPPADVERPSPAEYTEVLKTLTTGLDAAAASNPRPGRTESLRRLTRIEYQNAIRDLLGVRIDAAKLLPPDPGSHGFDNITVGELSPTLLDRYVSAARTVSRIATGGPRSVPGGDTFRVPADRTQERHVKGLPLGTRGGVLLDYTFPRDGQYEIEVRLARDRNEEVEGLRGRHTVLFLLDRREIARHDVKRPPDNNFSLADAHLKTRVQVKAGQHGVGITFISAGESLLETKRKPYDARFNMHRHARTAPAVFQVSISGPWNESSPGRAPTRLRLIGDKPVTAGNEQTAARRILSTVLRQAYRRPTAKADLDKAMRYFNQAWQENAATKTDATRQTRYEAGMRLALTSILVSPRFLFRVEPDPAGHPPGTPYQLGDLELATRLSFFLWSSIPDDELLRAAEAGRLTEPEELSKQIRRMLGDPKSGSLTTNFADQWLHLRNLDSITPDLRQFPDFDDNLRQAFRRETELFFESIHREDRSVLELLSADYTFLNERLARHYEIPHIYGSRFRRVRTDPSAHRGGLLRHGSILTVTSYATRTSPVIRGHWILKNLLGAPPPPPPANVPDLKENTVNASLPVRDRLAEHRSNTACAGCHQLMDPVGFALENFDAVGRWRTTDFGTPVDVSGGLPGFKEFEGVDGLEAALLQQPELFVSALTEKLMTYALGRVLDHNDAPAVRKIVRDARSENYRFSSLISGVVRSVPFTRRETAAATNDRPALPSAKK